MNKEQIIKALVREYRAEYTVYQLLERLSGEALREGDTKGHKALSRRVDLESRFLDGMKAAAAALGITETEFMAATGTVGEVSNDG